MLKEFRFKCELEGKPYPEPDGIAKLLKTRFKDHLRITGCIGIDDKSRNPKDDCIIMATWYLENLNKYVDIYYGNNTRIVTKVEWR